MSVRRTQREISSAEFAEWMAYATLEPFGPVREDQRSGVIASMIANVNRDTSAHPEPFTVDEFLPRYEGEDLEPQPTGDAQLESKLRTWAMAMNDANKEDDKKSKSELKPKKE